MSMRAAIVSEALSWLGTGYHHHGRIKGVGVDCAMLLAEVYERCGAIERVDPGMYPHDWHLHKDDEAFIGWLTKVGARRVDAPAAGDVAIFKYGRAFSHSGVIVSDDSVVHAYINRSVILSRWDEEPIAGRPVQYWSVLP